MPDLPDHFRLAPSSSARWLRCPGSLDAPIVEAEPGSASQIGTLGHRIVECRLRGEALDDKNAEFRQGLDDETAHWLDWAVGVCVSYIQELAGQLLFEQKIQSLLMSEHGGTVDVICVDGPLLHVIDFKFGRVKVDIDDNPQIKCYLNLAREQFPECSEFMGTIIQPRISDRPQTLRFELPDLLDHEADVLKASISDHLQAGDHCRYCPALGMCETAAQYIRDQVADFPDLTKFVGSVSGKPSNEQVATMCKMHKTHLLAKQATELSAGILKRWAREGADIHSHGLGLRSCRRTTWAKDAESTLMEIIGDGAGSYHKPPALVSPTELRKIVGMDRVKFDEVFGAALKHTDTTSLVMGRDVSDFPDFPDLS